MNRILLPLGIIAGLLAGGDTPALAQFSVDTRFAAEERIETLSLRIDLSADGENLQEPIALDLGLGFPLWLQPVGRTESERIPFGAVPQQSTAGTAVAARSSATFTFSLAQDPGQDPLAASPQLLAGVRVSDIARIGLAGIGDGGWILSGYEIRVNGRPFASNSGMSVSAHDLQESALCELADAQAAVGPLVAERDDLAALVEAQLATEDDAARLAEVEAQLAPLAFRQTRLEGQIAGRYAFFEEPEFAPPWRGESTVQSGRVTLFTCDHPGADTQNFVYFRTGGHKYLLNAGDQPLNAAAGAQQFDLDLLAGPLTAADLRGYAVGMLASGLPYGEAPDRWHPERILVELDGRIVYDSEESPIDHDSLEAIRLIPPAHLDENAGLVANAPTARETFVWEAGSAAGLDLAEGGPLDLPPQGDPTYPAVEPGLADVGLDMGMYDPWYCPGYELFPGEEGYYGPGGWTDEGWYPGWDSGWGTPPSWLDFVIVGMLNDLGLLPGGADPPPAGADVQVESVRITSGWRSGDTFTVAWGTSGDTGAVDHYEVALLPVYPENAVPFGPALATVAAPAGAGEADLSLPAIMPATPLYYLTPMVVAVPSDPAATPHERIGPALALFPSTASALNQPQLQNLFITTRPPFPMPMVSPVSFGGEPATADRAVWAAGQLESHNAILFDVPSPAWNVGVRPEPGDRTTLSFLVPSFTGRHRIVAHVGFLGGSDAANQVEVQMTCRLEPAAAGPPAYEYAPVSTGTLVNPAGGPPVPMALVEQVVDRTDPAWGGAANLVVSFRIEGGAVDPAHSPALFGVRMIPE